MARKPVGAPPKLRVIPMQTREPGLPPPSDLGPTGAELWRNVVRDYAFNDVGSVETLKQTCAAVDRAEDCRRQIEEDGLMIRTRTGVKEHPLLRHELTARSLAIRMLARLGLDLEPVRSGPGRPPGIGS